MNRDDVIDVLTAVHAADHRTIGEGDIALWAAAFEVCGHTIDKADAIAAVVRHALDPFAPYLKPGHIVAGAREIARDRMLRETPEHRQARTDAIDAGVEAKAAARRAQIAATAKVLGRIA